MKWVSFFESKNHGHTLISSTEWNLTRTLHVHDNISMHIHYYIPPPCCMEWSPREEQTYGPNYFSRKEFSIFWKIHTETFTFHETSMQLIIWIWYPLMLFPVLVLHYYLCNHYQYKHWYFLHTKKDCTIVNSIPIPKKTPIFLTY